MRYSIGVAIVGSGIFAREEHLPAIEACDDLRLLAVYSRSLKSAQGLIEGRKDIDLYSEDSGEGKGYKDLLARSDIQAVVVVLPILTQPDFIRAALEASKHVISEKPIAKDLTTARELIQWYEAKIDKAKATWAIAENYRYMHSFDYAQSQVQKLGRILTFRCRMQTMVKQGGKYFETAWRKTPSYQGGFLLDGGVHAAAVLRLLLGSDYVSRIAAFSTQLQSHLPPHDTIEASAKTVNGALGSISLSFGTTDAGNEWLIGCEGGSVYLNRDEVRVKIDGKEEVKKVPDERTGVPVEIRAWAKGIKTGQFDEKQGAKEALADLELIEILLQSGESNGTPMDLQYQKM